MSFAYIEQDATKIVSILPSMIDAYDRCIHFRSSTASSANTTLWVCRGSPRTQSKDLYSEIDPFEDT